MTIKTTGKPPGKKKPGSRFEKKQARRKRLQKLRQTLLERRRARILERYGYDVTRTYSALPGDDDTEGYPGALPGIDDTPGYDPDPDSTTEGGR